MRRRDWYEQRIDKRAALDAAEEKGEVADSKEFRLALMARVHSGEISIEEAQSELRKVKRNAKKNGQKTRSQVWRSA
ncbi:TPA: hypothetical protein L3884_003262 [Pseudomonas aeruginosa]|uniref:hypothetical protein n=1 Tax=Pseudomonas aeruginosa TaxID=287 RepID=UPI001F4AAB26|nr:hypothetical protein [Pseudomonas aeruginosa]MCU9198541.1 hypothetical protein [Pseudomonas aeruginosa]HBN9600911.1 hypothetical protein [Pseudomonas aeruginosa]